MNLDDFLQPFYPEENEPIYFRAFKPKDAPDADNNRPQNLMFTRNDLSQQDGILRLRGINHTRGVYFTPNAGGKSDDEITRFNAVFVENDSLPIEEQTKLLDASPLPTSIRVLTKRSVHAYWLLSENCSTDAWRDMQKRLIAYFDGDRSIKNPSRVMRLPGFWYVTYNENAGGNYEYKPIELLELNEDRRYSKAELQRAFPEIKDPFSTNHTSGEIQIITNGSRNNQLFSIAGSLRHKGLAENEIAATLHEVNKTRVIPPLPADEVNSIAKGITRYEPEASVFSNGVKALKEFNAEIETESLSIPVLSDAALYGLAGEIVRTIEPHTEADKAALLVQLLAGFGSLVGKTAYFRAEVDFHYTKLNAVLVGASSKGRKGSSWGQIRRLLLRADETFANCIQDGLSSGEGLIFHVRDAQIKKVPVKEKGRIIDYQDEIVDEGATEKRAFVIEPEFARVLRAMSRDGNTLSSIVRQAWDSDSLRIMTKNPVKATEAHISIVGHITTDELRRNLDETETSNGFANRFLWTFTRRSKYLPEGGNLQDSQLNPQVEKLHKAVLYARLTKEMKRDEEARQKWISVYQKLSDGHTGLLGSVTSRAEAQVMRMACIYALLDCSEVIRVEHLDAALGFWQYAEDSAKYIFGSQTGNKVADTIFSALQKAKSGMTRTQIRDLFQRNLNASQINAALKLLIELGRIEMTKESTDGRNVEIYRAIHYDKNDINDKSL